MRPKVQDSWHFWQKSQKALNDLTDVMQVFATNISQVEPLDLPPHVVKEARHALKKFEENFALMLREVKRKAER